MRIRAPLQRSSSAPQPGAGCTLTPTPPRCTYRDRQDPPTRPRRRSPPRISAGHLMCAGFRAPTHDHWSRPLTAFRADGRRAQFCSSISARGVNSRSLQDRLQRLKVHAPYCPFSLDGCSSFAPLRPGKIWRSEHLSRRQRSRQRRSERCGAVRCPRLTLLGTVMRQRRDGRRRARW